MRISEGGCEPFFPLDKIELLAEDERLIHLQRDQPMRSFGIPERTSLDGRLEVTAILAGVPKPKLGGFLDQPRVDMRSHRPPPARTRDLRPISGEGLRRLPALKVESKSSTDVTYHCGVE